MSIRNGQASLILLVATLTLQEEKPKVQSKSANEKFRDNYDSIFGPKDNALNLAN